jgi:pyruvate,water dikinase
LNRRWSETPDYILKIVRGYLHATGDLSPLQKQERLTQERLALTAQCRKRLRNPLKRWIFSASLRRAQRLAINREAWKNEAVREMAFLRRVLLLLGRRLSETGILSEPEDIFFLSYSELKVIGTSNPGLRERILARRHEYAYNLTLSPPPLVFGQYRPDQTGLRRPTPDATVLEGIAVSPGVVSGPARVILRTDDHEQVLQGEILVAPFTDPAWTPYFVTAAGVVMDQGGILSHGSIVAREFGLPAVTNAHAATRVIRTGDIVEVDGNRGRVTILQRGTN